MRLIPTILTLGALWVTATPCTAQVLSPAAQQEVQRLQRTAAQSGQQIINPAFCQQAKQKAAQWRARATTLASPWRENLLASADQQDISAAQCLKRSSGLNSAAQYSLAQAERIKNHQPLLFPQRSQSTTQKYNRARKDLEEIIGIVRESIQRMDTATPRLRKLAGTTIAHGAAEGNPRDVISTVSQQEISNAMGALGAVRLLLESVQKKYERLNFEFADKLNTDSYLEDPRNVVFDTGASYTDALNAIEYEWVMFGNEIAWSFGKNQWEINAWAGQEAAAAETQHGSVEHERAASLAAANNNPGNPNAVLGNRKGPEALLKFEAATQPGIEAYCARYEKTAANEALAVAAKVQATVAALTERRNFLMQIRNRLGIDLAFPADLNRNGRTPLNFPAQQFSSAWATSWPPGLAFKVAVPGYGHPDAYHVGARIGFIECPDWRDQMPKDIAVRFRGVKPVFSGNGIAYLNVNLINPLVLEGEAEGRAPEQRL